MKVLVCCCALALVALGLWFVAARARMPENPRIGPTSVRETRVASVDADSGLDATDADRRASAATSDSTRTASPATRPGALTVRSSVGLTLSSVEWELDDGSWRAVALDRGRCAVDAARRPARIRAPGHAPALVAPADELVVLEPDALLVLEASGLKSCVGSVLPHDPFVEDHSDGAAPRPELRKTMEWGWLSEDRWALAVSSGPMEAADEVDRRGGVRLR